MQKRVIAIVGAGFSGSMVAVHLLRQATAPLTIYLIERRSALGQLALGQPALGCGVAYSTPLDCHLLNVPAGKISAFSDDPTHFLRWLHQYGFPDSTAATFAPRRSYGSYLQATLADAVQNAAPGVKLDVSGRRSDRPPAKRRSSRGLLEQRRDSNSRSAVVLALGNLPPKNPNVADPVFYQSRRYIRSAGQHRS